MSQQPSHPLIGRHGQDRPKIKISSFLGLILSIVRYQSGESLLANYFLGPFPFFFVVGNPYN